MILCSLLDSLSILILILLIILLKFKIYWVWITKPCCCYCLFHILSSCQLVWRYPITGVFGFCNHMKCVIVHVAADRLLRIRSVVGLLSRHLRLCFRHLLTFILLYLFIIINWLIFIHYNILILLLIILNH